jgi:PilZ domain
MQERRQEVRERTFYGGEIAFNKRASSMGCLVRNLSSQGAMLALADTATIPDKFDLNIERKARSFRARTVWRRMDEAGVEFVEENAGAEPMPIETVKRLRRDKAEKEALRRRVDELTTGY